jgi:hypothetical protein
MGHFKQVGELSGAYDVDAITSGAKPLQCLHEGRQWLMVNYHVNRNATAVRSRAHNRLHRGNDEINIPSVCA